MALAVVRGRGFGASIAGGSKQVAGGSARIKAIASYEATLGAAKTRAATGAGHDGALVQHTNMLPLVLDLDGTTVRTDTLVENGLRVLAESPWAFISLLPGALGSRAALKRAMARAHGL
jgi:hypothetical protein